MFQQNGSPRSLGVLLTAALLAAAIAEAQSATGSIEGLVVDRSGAVVPGVTIAVLHRAMGLDRRVVTDDAGLFRVPLLPAGHYDLTAVLSGFQTVKQTELRLTVGQTIAVRLEMEVAPIAHTVTVSAASVVDKGRTGAAATVTNAAVQHLPVNGRNFLDFVLLTPGVTRDVRAGDLSFAGQRGTLNSLIVDGADNNQTFAGQSLGRTGSGRAPYQFSLDAVQEFQVNSNAYSAEYGRAGGAVINVVTKSGTNRMNGSAFEFYRDKALNANHVIARLNGQPKPAYRYHQFGATLGGPLRRNRDFFFLTYDGQRNTESNPVFLNVPANTPADSATVAGIERLRPLAFTWPLRLDQDVGLIRIDHHVGSRHRLTARYNHQNFAGRGYESGRNPQNTFEHTGDSLVRTRTLNASLVSVAGTSMFNELKVQYARDHEPGGANTVHPEAVIRQGGAIVLMIGRNNFSPREHTIDRVQVADTLTVARGAHKLKTGVDIQFDRIRNFFPGLFSGSYEFRSLASFAPGDGRPDGIDEFYRQNFPGPGTSGAETTPHVSEYSLFAQDEWAPRHDLTVTAGIRYDLMTSSVPRVRNPDAQLAAADIDTSRLEADVNNAAPRVGLAWSPHGRRLVFRVGSGIFYGRTPAIMWAAASNNGINIVSLTFTGDDVPTYPQSFSEIPIGRAAEQPNIFYVDREFANARLMHASMAFEYEILPHTTVTATYLFVDGSDLPRSVDRNLGGLTARTYTIGASGQAVEYPRFASRRFGNFNRVIAFESSAESRYHGVTMEVNRRFTDGFEFRAAYTLGKVVDTVPDATAVTPGSMGDDLKYISNPVDFDVDRTVGNNDQRHRFVASAVYATRTPGGGRSRFVRALAGGWWFSGILSAQSGQPYSARVGGVDLNNDGNRFNDLAPGTRRNAFRLPPITTVDARIARELPLVGRARVHLIWEAFNVFNRDNITFVVPAYYSVAGTTLTRNPLFGRPLASAGERIMQLAVKTTF